MKGFGHHFIGISLKTFREQNPAVLDFAKRILTDVDAGAAVLVAGTQKNLFVGHAARIVQNTAGSRLGRVLNDS